MGEGAWSKGAGSIRKQMRVFHLYGVLEYGYGHGRLHPLFGRLRPLPEGAAWQEGVVAVVEVLVGPARGESCGTDADCLQDATRSQLLHHALWTVPGQGRVGSGDPL